MNKEYKDIKDYGEWFLKLLCNYKYCLRRNLHRTHLHLFNQTRLMMMKGSFTAVNPKINIRVESWHPGHYNNN